MIVLYCILLFFIIGLFITIPMRGPLDEKIVNLFAISIIGGIIGFLVLGLLLVTMDFNLIPYYNETYQIEQFPKQDEYVLYCNNEFIVRKKDGNDIRINRIHTLKIIPEEDEASIEIIKKDYSNKILRHLMPSPLDIEYIIRLPASEKIIPVQEVKVYEEYS